LFSEKRADSPNVEQQVDGQVSPRHAVPINELHHNDQHRVVGDSQLRDKGQALHSNPHPLQAPAVPMLSDALLHPRRLEDHVVAGLAAAQVEGQGDEAAGLACEGQAEAVQAGGEGGLGVQNGALEEHWRELQG
jgi:hypothetical protein